MTILPPEVILAVNAALLLISGIITMLLLRTGVHYAHSVGDSAAQDTQKKAILIFVLSLFALSLLAASFNVLVSSI